MNGAGNDFIIINNAEEHLSPEALPRVARTLCRRRLSIGADGLMAVDRSDRADCRMLFFNADGSAGEMCGNGGRCLCRYIYENGMAGEEQVIETAAGIVRGRRIDRRQYRLRLNDPSVIERRELELYGIVRTCVYVELGDPGVPHAVVPIQNLRDRDPGALFALGRDLRHHPAFPKGANVNFYEIVGPDHIYLRTWERGVEDFTYACGTGTGSVAAALTLSGAVSGRHVKADMPGGQLIVDVERDGAVISDIFLTGPTNIVAKGKVTDEELF